MIADLGTAAMVATIALALAAACAWVMAAREGRTGRAARLARYCTAGSWLGSACAVGLMWWALLTNDTTVGYVADTGSETLPLVSRITALWAGSGGSLLLWMLVLASCIAVFARSRRGRELAGTAAHALAAATLMAVFAGFALLTMAGVAPFRTPGVVPPDGPGPNPLLQDHVAMTVHPPLLYVGFTALAVPFALAIGALASGRVDAPWARLVRAWTLFAWVFLTVGIGLGAWWAYGVLGWGGYWAWDPVENVSLMPWLVATALLHIVRSPGRSAGWAAGAVALTGAAFLLVLLGTLLTRSGAVLSVHAFADSPIGIHLLVLFGVVLVGWTVLLISRRDRLGTADPPATNGSATSQPALLSRQTAIRAQTVLLSLITACVFLGTVLPVLVQAIGGEQLTVGAPWFNRTLAPLALATIALMALGPLVAWNSDDAGALLQRLFWPGVGALAAVGVAGLAGPGGVYLPLVTGLAVFVIATLARHLAPRRGTGRRTRRRTGALVAHTGIALAAVAVVATSYSTSEQHSLNTGDTLTTGEVSATLLGVESWNEDRRSVAAARVLLGDGTRSQGIVEPELHFYPSHSMVVADPVARGGWAREIQVSLVDVDPDEGTAAFRVTVTPVLWLLWAAIAVTAAGGAIAAWPSRRRRPPRTTLDGPAPHRRPRAPVSAALTEARR